MSEGKNPVHVRGGENVTVTQFTIEGPNESVLVFLDRASWDAMVERAAEVAFEMQAYHGGPTWEDNDDGSWYDEAAAYLRAALALPPEWEPEG